MVPSTNEDKVHEHDDHVRRDREQREVLNESEENVITTYDNATREASEAPIPKEPIIVTESDENVTTAFDNATREGSVTPIANGNETAATNGSEAVNGNATVNGVSVSNGSLTANGHGV